MILMNLQVGQYVDQPNNDLQSFYTHLLSLYLYICINISFSDFQIPSIFYVSNSTTLFFNFLLCTSPL